MQKFPARLFTTETALDFHPGKAGETAGLVVVGGGMHASLALTHASEGNQLLFQINGETYFKTAAPAGEVRLRIAVDETAKCTFCFASPNGPFTTLEKTFQAREGGWIGAKVGLFAVGASAGGDTDGRADFSYFRFLPEKPAAT
jgi:FtsP/CotA-like multicopper oxidase with cupredoxin domain